MRVPSSEEDNMFYHISLIDVSQKWDRQKKSEKWWKKFIGKKDVSAQQPSFYQERFMNFMREITTFDITENMFRYESSFFVQKGVIRESELI